jgi:endonuclease YncB( thermonuclease family)
MIAKFIAAIMCLLVFSSPSLAGQFQVTTVYDGDTIMAEGYGIVLYVLLAGIDAPEIALQNHEQDQPFAKEAKRYLEETILNKRVQIKGYGSGPNPYDHLIGEIFLQDKNINIGLIKEGLAEVWREQLPRGLVIAPYIDAEQEAKKARRGIWSLGDAYVSPREWRRIHAQPW